MLIVAYLSFLLIKPFIGAILAAIILTYIFYPLYNWLNSKIKRKGVSSMLVTLFVILLITVPSVFVVNKLTRETYISYVILKQKFTTGDIFGIGCDGSGKFLCTISEEIKEVASDNKVRAYLNDTLQRLASFITKKTSDLILAIPNLILNIFIIFFTMFYLFIDGKDILKKIRCCLPIKKSHQEKIYKRFKEMTFAVVYGSIITAVIQGILGGIGFAIFGFSSPIFWGIIMAVFALIPYGGTAIVWLPAALIKIVGGYFGGDMTGLWQGIGLLVYGAIIVGTIDNILRPKIIGSKAKVHPVLVLIGVFGGLAFFGIVGVIVGPLILTLLLTLFEIYLEDKKNSR